jgi:peptide chain release factor subunit 1
MLEDIGFVFIDDNKTLFGTLAGNTINIIKQINVAFPKRHGRGGLRSNNRFKRQRMEALHNYANKVTELCVQCFIKNDIVQVSGLILAGPVEFTRALVDILDQRLKDKIIKIVDVIGEQGFNEAIEIIRSGAL